MINNEIQKWITNAENGISQGRAGYVLTSKRELTKLGKSDVAEAILRKALQEGSWNDPSEINMLTSLCKIIMSKGSKEDFEEVLELIKASTLKDLGLVVMEATALGKLDRRLEAISILEKTMEVEPEVKYHPGFASKLSTLYLEIGKDQKAVDFLAPVVERGPLGDRLEMKQILADAYLKTKKEERVIPLLADQRDRRSRELIERAQEALGGSTSIPINNPLIFVIHGHEKGSLSKLINVLYDIGAKPVTFDDLPKPGAPTVIELLEKHIPSFNAIITLLTPDDEGRRRGTDNWELRARENVLIEAGYSLISNRKRSLLIALGGVSIPSDLEGIHRIEASEWSSETGLRVARRLEEMRINVDPTRAIK